MSALPVAVEWFERRALPDGVTLLSEPHVDPFARCNVWHVRGRDRDLVIDAGLGLRSLRQAALDLFERPVTAVLTHAHFDHTGGAYESTSGSGTRASSRSTPRRAASTGSPPARSGTTSCAACGAPGTNSPRSS